MLFGKILSRHRIYRTPVGKFQHQPVGQAHDVRAAAAVPGGTVLITQPPEGGTRVILSIPIRADLYSEMRSLTLRIDYAGEKDHGLLELSDVLPPSFYAKRDFKET